MQKPIPVPNAQAADPYDFSRRHIGVAPDDAAAMLRIVGAANLDELVAQTIPASIRQRAPLNGKPALSETEALDKLREIAAKTSSRCRCSCSAARGW